jgi:predicted nucleic acid-binding protein
VVVEDNVFSNGFSVVLSEFNVYLGKQQVAFRWAKLVADLRVAGQAMSIKDSLIAATLLVHDLTMVTRKLDTLKRRVYQY